jgi:hypothetical protein
VTNITTPSTVDNRNNSVTIIVDMDVAAVVEDVDVVDDPSPLSVLRLSWYCSGWPPATTVNDGWFCK